ncbi:unnamed protein product, partial [Iphiclides podalirius]
MTVGRETVSLIRILHSTSHAEHNASIRHTESRFLLPQQMQFVVSRQILTYLCGIGSETTAGKVDSTIGESTFSSLHPFFGDRHDSFDDTFARVLLLSEPVVCWCASSG